MIIRKANEKDIDSIEIIYNAIHIAEENGEVRTGWEKGVYPIRKTAEDALKRGGALCNGRRMRRSWQRNNKPKSSRCLRSGELEI
ncbi:hypothetical protein [Peptoniphilus sp.]|uniref:hypothetical protein n=1 Tax=Peptoniphilus sp. TaxID=1971214 RepID=UPI0039963B91